METTNNQKPIWTRKIVHIGVDCFYSAIIARDNPQLQGSPLIVCRDDPAKRHLICSANYEARKFGVYAGMGAYRAKQLCPQVVILLFEMRTYNKESKKIHAICHRFSDMVELLSLDEAYLDVTDSGGFGRDADIIANEIRKLIHEEIKITASAGIAPNKYLAKVASYWEKPNGQFSITPDMLDNFLLKLPLSKVWGIAEKTIKKMTNLMLNTCGDLQKLSLSELDSNFGGIGKHLYDICRGIDNRPVVASKEPIPLSIEEIFRTDIQIVGESKEGKKPLNVNGLSPGKPTGTKTDEDTQEMSKIYTPIATLFNNATAVFIEFKEKKYPAKLAENEPGKHLVFIVPKADTYLGMNVSEGDDVVLRLLTNTGELMAFESKLIRKKLPRLVLEFPLKENEGFIRAKERISTRINANIIRINKKLFRGKGIVFNLNDIGCSFTTNAILERKDEIELAILLPEKGIEKDHWIRGTIRRVRRTNDEQYNYGIECSDGDKKTMMRIKKFVESQKKREKHKTTK